MMTAMIEGQPKTKAVITAAAVTRPMTMLRPWSA
jgi:hypothetical protein